VCLRSNVLLKMAIARSLHKFALGVGVAAFSVALLSFVLGEIENEASGRGPELEFMRLGQEKAKGIVYWDRAGFGDVGLRTARAINRAIGEHSGLGNNFARGWVLAIAGGCIALGVGVCGYYLTLAVGAPFPKRQAEQAGSSDGDKPPN
jgi:hypothetical protein